uniref:Uncharacterized protein n=1 Tax=Arundo donax TaxID=35708 RepID=A0A0A9HIM8_ARUDO
MPTSYSLARLGNCTIKSEVKVSNQ